MHPANDHICNQYYLSSLNPEDYRRSDGCDFSKYVRRFRPKELEITCDNIHRLKIEKFIGGGAAGRVYAGNWLGTKVAVKMPKDNNLMHAHAQSLVEQVAILQKLRKAPNIIPILGWCNTTIVMPKAVGTLGDFILHRKTPLPMKRALRLCLDIAKGVEQLHVSPFGAIVHNDIKYAQFLYNSEGRLLLADLGSKKYAGFSNTNKKKCYFERKGKMPKSGLDEKIDIYAIGGLMDTVLQRTRLEFPQAMKDLISEALDANPIKRPSAREMHVRIKSILSGYRNI